jgi:hypothetical protein
MFRCTYRHARAYPPTFAPMRACVDTIHAPRRGRDGPPLVLLHVELVEVVHGVAGGAPEHVHGVVVDHRHVAVAGDRRGALLLGLGVDLSWAGAGVEASGWEGVQWHWHHHTGWSGGERGGCGRRMRSLSVCARGRGVACVRTHRLQGGPAAPLEAEDIHVVEVLGAVVAPKQVHVGILARTYVRTATMQHNTADPRKESELQAPALAPAVLDAMCGHRYLVWQSDSTYRTRRPMSSRLGAYTHRHTHAQTYTHTCGCSPDSP